MYLQSAIEHAVACDITVQIVWFSGKRNMKHCQFVKQCNNYCLCEALNRARGSNSKVVRPRGRQYEMLNACYVNGRGSGAGACFPRKILKIADVNLLANY